MKKPMDDVQMQLAHERISKATGMTPRRRHTDEYLSVLERDDVSRPGYVHEPAVQCGDATIRNEKDRYLSRWEEPTGLESGARL
jgi:hypothetical protein